MCRHAALSREIFLCARINVDSPPDGQGDVTESCHARTGVARPEPVGETRSDSRQHCSVPAITSFHDIPVSLSPEEPNPASVNGPAGRAEGMHKLPWRTGPSRRGRYRAPPLWEPCERDSRTRFLRFAQTAYIDRVTLTSVSGNFLGMTGMRPWHSNHPVRYPASRPAAPHARCRPPAHRSLCRYPCHADGSATGAAVRVPARW